MRGQMTWSSESDGGARLVASSVRGRVQAGVHVARPVASAWELEELELPVFPDDDDNTADDRHDDSTQRDTDIEKLRRDRETAAIEQVNAEAFARGLSQGRTEGENAARMQLSSAAEALTAATTQLRAEEQRYLHGLEENLAALAVTVARQIIGREVRQDATLVVDLVRRALTEFPLDQPIRVRVHPLDLSAITTATTSEGAPLEVAPQRDLAWLADARLQRGGAMLEGRERVVDGRVDLALERAYRRLANLPS
jgi:flagellar assembly protein FliH